jgi:hypothetical protein
MRTIRLAFASSTILVATCLAACGGQTSGPGPGSGAGAGSGSISGTVGGTTFQVASAVAGIEAASAESSCSFGPDGGQSCVTTSSGKVVFVALTNRADATCDYIQSESTSGTQTNLASFDVLLLAVGSLNDVAPGTYAVTAAVGPTPGAAAELQTSTASCATGVRVAATSGTITLTQAGAAGEVAGSYSLTFGAQGTFSGSFDVPVCNLPDGGTQTAFDAGPPVCKQ